MKFFRKKNQAVKNWRNRALIIDFSKTRLTIAQKGIQESKIPEWAYEEFITN